MKIEQLKFKSKKIKVAKGKFNNGYRYLVTKDKKHYFCEISSNIHLYVDHVQTIDHKVVERFLREWRFKNSNLCITG